MTAQVPTNSLLVDLKFEREHRSIKSLPLPTTLPAFTLITGLNGAGKSHLLEAILNGFITVSVSGVPVATNEIKFASWQSLIPNDAGAFAEGTLDQERQNFRQQFRASIGQHRQNIEAQLRAFGLTGRPITDWKYLSILTEETVAPYSNGSMPPNQLIPNIQNHLNNYSQAILNQNQDPSYKKLLETASKMASAPICALTDYDFSSARVPSWGSSDLFQNQFGRLFVAYRKLEKENWIKQHLAQKGEAIKDALSDEDFVATYRQAPWEFVNTAIQDAGLDFEIDCPHKFSTETYEPKIRKVSTGAEIPFAALSSGERVLMSFAMVLYYAEDQRALINYPKVLLLDEVDASLHPSMSAHLIRIIEKTLVERNNICVIATTHSPSTVALAPESSIHIVSATQPGVHKTLKAKALNILTQGVPTLALSFEGRRQVFVESPVDAEVYSLLWQLLKAHCDTDRSLEFISPGIKNPKDNSDIHTGCSVVNHLVKTLEAAGVSSTFGLVDWDAGRNKPDGRVHVLAAGKRDGIENVLLDPRLLLALILRTTKAKEKLAETLGLKGVSYLDYVALEQVKLQPMVDKVTAHVLGHESSPDTDVTYMDGVVLKLSSAYLTMDDHALAKLILEKIPSFMAFGNSEAALMFQMIKSVVTDRPTLLPSDLIETLRPILAAEPH
jgi:ABC-type Mn2+/Zn2+ transport system ATPase subunit